MSILPVILLASCGVLPDAVPPVRPLPQLSPHATVSQTIGNTTVTISYDRPAVHGRKVWGDLVLFNQVWRSGANWATTITFSGPVTVEGHEVPAGRYALFTIPRAESWTVILNKRWKQWGAFEYQPKEDLLRFDVRSKQMKDFTEWLTYEIYPASRASAYVDIYWEKLRVSFLVEVDVDAQVMAKLKADMAKASPTNWKLYADAAEYLLEQDRQTGDALAWIDKSIAIKKTPENLYVKAKLLWTIGKTNEAKHLIDAASKLAQERKSSAAVTGPIAQTREQWEKSGLLKP